MIVTFFIPLVAVGIIVYVLTRLGVKIDQLDYQLYDIKRVVDDLSRKLDRIAESAPAQHAVPASSETTEVFAQDSVPDNVPDANPEYTPEEMSQAIPEYMPEYTPEATPEVSADVVEEYIPPVDQPTKRRLNIEKLVGENLFSKIGIFALIIGIGFFVKYAIDNDWINEATRTILGLVTGFGLWGIAYRLRDSYRGFSSVLAGGGFAICFVSIAIAYNFYQLIPSWLTFSSLVLLTAAMILISVKFDRLQLAMIAIIGGYVAPFMSASGSGSVLMLLAYTTILNAAMFYVSIKKNWWVLSVPACLITWFIVAITPVKIAHGVVGLVFSILFLIMFSLPLALTIWRDMKPMKLYYSLIVTSVVNMFAYTALALEFIGYVDGLNNMKCIVPLIVAGLNITVYFKYYRMQSAVLVKNLLLGSVIVFALMSVIVQFSDPDIVAIFFAVFVMALLEIYGRTSNRLFAISAIVLAIITFMILNAGSGSYIGLSIADLQATADFPTVGSFTTTLVCGMCYFAYAVIISRWAETFRIFLSDVYDLAVSAACFAATYLQAKAFYALMTIVKAQEAGLPAIAVMIMACLLFMSIFFSRNLINRLVVPGLALLLFIILNFNCDTHTLLTETLQWLSACLFVGVLVIQMKSTLTGSQLKNDGVRNRFVVYYAIVGSLFIIAVSELILRTVALTEYYSAGFSVALIINGAVLLVLGMRYKCLTLRFIGLGMFGLLLLKLVIYDLWLLPMVGRIIVFILLGAVLLTLSFMYQRLRSKLFDKE